MPGVLIHSSILSDVILSAEEPIKLCDLFVDIQNQYLLALLGSAMPCVQLEHRKLLVRLVLHHLLESRACFEGFIVSRVNHLKNETFDLIVSHSEGSCDVFELFNVRHHIQVWHPLYDLSVIVTADIAVLVAGDDQGDQNVWFEACGLLLLAQSRRLEWSFCVFAFTLHY